LQLLGATATNKFSSRWSFSKCTTTHCMVGC